MCGSHTYTAYTFHELGGHFCCVALFEGNSKELVVAISFLDLLEFIATVKFVPEVLSVTEIV
jgi:hypothetical protein